MNLIPSTVTGGWTESQYPCFLDPAVDWNGWACPYFTREVAEQVLNDTITPPGEYAFSETGDFFLIVDVFDKEDEIYHGVATEHGTLYAIGAWAWCWELVEEVKS